MKTISFLALSALALAGANASRLAHHMQQQTAQVDALSSVDVESSIDVESSLDVESAVARI